MFILSSWRSHLGSVGVDLLHQEPARTVGDPFTAYVCGEVTQVYGILRLLYADDLQIYIQVPAHAIALGVHLLPEAAKK